MNWFSSSCMKGDLISLDLFGLLVAQNIFDHVWLWLPPMHCQLINMSKLQTLHFSDMLYNDMFVDDAERRYLQNLVYLPVNCWWMLYLHVLVHVRHVAAIRIYRIHMSCALFPYKIMLVVNTITVTMCPFPWEVLILSTNNHITVSVYCTRWLPDKQLTDN